MTAVQNFTGLAELRTTSVEENGVLCVRDTTLCTTHLMRFRHETYSKCHFQQRVSTVLAVHPTGLAESPMSKNQESWKCPKESTAFACVANAFHSNFIATDLEPT